MLKREETLIKTLKDSYPVGTRIRLVKMDDPYSRLVPGDLGTVTGVDDIGTVHVKWDCGSNLGLVYPEDEFEIAQGD